MTTCDLCGKPKGKFDGIILTEKYRRPAIEEICNECNKQLGVMITEVRAIQDNITNQQIKALWEKMITETKEAGKEK